MKKLSSIVLLLLLAFTIVGCTNGSYGNSNQNNENASGVQNDNYENGQQQEQHVHSFTNATCTEAPRCSCGETSGNALGHNWENATCQDPKTCKTCGETSGNALGHNWENATCQAPKTCKTCGATSGEAVGHNWKNATCQAPKTCTVCAITDGDKAQHSMNGQGVCNECGQDVFLEFVKENVSLNLIVPSVGASDNYYCEVKFVNHTGYNMELSAHVYANGKGCVNLSAAGYVIETGYSAKCAFYRSIIPEDRWDDEYKDVYLDNNSTAETVIYINGRKVNVKFGTNGVIDVGE